MNKNSIYQVCTTNEEVYVCVKEKASYMNCNPLRAFLHEMVEDGNRFFVIDFQHCSSMDSTFLGILVGLALQLRKHEVPGKLTLINLVGRNLETRRKLQPLEGVSPSDPEYVQTQISRHYFVAECRDHFY